VRRHYLSGPVPRRAGLSSSSSAWRASEPERNGDITLRKISRRAGRPAGRTNSSARACWRAMARRFDRKGQTIAIRRNAFAGPRLGDQHRAVQSAARNCKVTPLAILVRAKFWGGRSSACSRKPLRDGAATAQRSTRDCGWQEARFSRVGRSLGLRSTDYKLSVPAVAGGARDRRRPMR